MNRKICFVTGTRAEYGLLRWVMQSVKDDPNLSLQIVVTGMHLSPDFGLTYKIIEQDGFKIDRKAENKVGDIIIHKGWLIRGRNRRCYLL